MPNLVQAQTFGVVFSLLILATIIVMIVLGVIKKRNKRDMNAILMSPYARLNEPTITDIKKTIKKINIALIVFGVILAIFVIVVGIYQAISVANAVEAMKDQPNETPTVAVQTTYWIRKGI